MAKTKRKNSRLQKMNLKVNGQEIPVKIYFEDRLNVRFSLTSTAAHLRLPVLLSEEDRKKQWVRFQAWLKEALNKNEALFSHHKSRVYKDGSTLKVGKHTYHLRIRKQASKTHRANIKENTIFLTLSTMDEGLDLQKNIRHLLSRCIAHHRLPDISERVHHYNSLYFKKPIKSINFKLNKTNWGSCSSKNNINLSTRLLFAPESVIDYVIIHELAHLIEMNHSPRFWKIVSDIMPNYEEKEEWLKENSHLCNF